MPPSKNIGLSPEREHQEEKTMYNFTYAYSNEISLPLIIIIITFDPKRDALQISLRCIYVKWNLSAHKRYNEF